MASLLVVTVLLLVAATPARVNELLPLRGDSVLYLLFCLVFTGELPLAAETDSLLQAAGHGVAPTAEPLTKSKTVRCFKQNVLRDDGRNYEVEHIRKDEDVVESVQRSGRDLRLSADAAVPPGCVVVTSVRQDEGDGGGGGGGGGGAHHDMTLAHFPEYPQYGVGGQGGGLHVGEVVLPQLPYPVQGVSLSGGGGFEYGGGGGGAGGGGGQISDVLLPRPGGGYGYGSGSGGGVDNFINFKDVSGGSSGSPPHQHGGAGSADGGGGGGGGNGGEAEVLRTYQVSTNLRRQESFDHHAFGVEKGVKPTGGFHFGFGGGSGNSNGLGAGTKYETSANDLDQVVSSGAAVATAAASLLACAVAQLLAL